MSVMRVFGPINSGYSTGMMAYTEHSGSWESEKEIAEGYLNNMGASYGDDGNWGDVQKVCLPRHCPKRMLSSSPVKVTHGAPSPWIMYTNLRVDSRSPSKP